MRQPNFTIKVSIRTLVGLGVYKKTEKKNPRKATNYITFLEIYIKMVEIVNLEKIGTTLTC